jgi:CheY-like chemotaxis protein|tara:strand:+ start:969 stop:2192 length:1224 start_codon:yes stop_codon:yes gene_type:complete
LAHQVLLCTNFEEAVDVFERYARQVIGVITDAGFPRNGEHEETAGIAFARRVFEERPEVPLMVQSAQPEGSSLQRQAQALGAKYVSKNSPALLRTLRDFMRSDMSMGPLHFKDGETGRELGSVSTVTELLKTWERLPLSSVAYHARHSHLSKWFLARAEFQLAKRFRNSNYPADFIDSSGKERPDWLRNWILSEVLAHRNKLASGVENAGADPGMPLVRLGSGSLGGKGRGFRFLNQISERHGFTNLLPNLALVVPSSFILATGVFDQFMEDNDLLLPATTAEDDAALRGLFGAAALPSAVTEELRRHLSSMTKPLAVRSSSIFEDAFLRPFAGVYDSFMLPNSAPSVEVRLEQLCWAIKMVYASTYKREALRYAELAGSRIEEEKMAVILQEVPEGIEALGGQGCS